MCFFANLSIVTMNLIRQAATCEDIQNEGDFIQIKLKSLSVQPRGPGDSIHEAKYLKSLFI